MTRPDPATPTAEDLLDLVARVLRDDNIRDYAIARHVDYPQAWRSVGSKVATWLHSPLRPSEYRLVAARLAELMGKPRTAATPPAETLLDLDARVARYIAGTLIDRGYLISTDPEGFALAFRLAERAGRNVHQEIRERLAGLAGEPSTTTTGSED